MSYEITAQQARDKARSADPDAIHRDKAIQNAFVTIWAASRLGEMEAVHNFREKDVEFISDIVEALVKAGHTVTVNENNESCIISWNESDSAAS